MSVEEGNPAAFWRSRLDAFSRCVGCHLMYAADSESDRELHRRVHADRVRRVHNTFTKRVEHGCVAVDWESPMGAKHAAYGLGVLFQREIEIDFNPAPYPERLAIPEDHGLHCVVAIRSGWAVGLAVLRQTTIGGLRNADGRLETFNGVDTVWCIADIYVLPNMRRLGIGAELVRYATERLGIQITDCSWGWPLSDDGAALAQRLTDRLWIHVSA